MVMMQGATTEIPLPPAEIADATALLVARAQAGDKAAFAMLYRSHVGRVHALCRRMTGDAGVAEELTQDAFVQAWRQLHTFRGTAQFSTWLHRVAVNTVLSWQRRHGPWLQWLRRDRGEIPEQAVVENTGVTLDLDAAIARLPLRARQVFVLVDVEGHTHEEAAGLLGINVGTSKSQLFRARELLRGWLT
jgi:RNA polymerase sigma-70 factor, ECF subfamily